ncbi:MAG: alpha/beta fold hydrolase [Candidatus Buchananbacteria bacterium]
MAEQKYNHQEIEAKWQKIWEQEKLFAVKEDKKIPKDQRVYVLDMFPYPSGEGLHVGHPEGYTATDIYSRYQRAQGKLVLHPMGWDAFGLPAENYAIKTGTHPAVTTQKNIDNIRRQIKALGFSYDWSREVNTTDPAYYKWTQWIFLQLFNRGLAYESQAPINFCPSCKTGLANEEVKDGKCDRCGTAVVKKSIRQWILKITDYADRLEKDLALLDWPESIKILQRNWIGRSEGVQFDLPLTITNQKLSVYTTRIDTVFGMTFCVIAPEHPLVASLLEIKEQNLKIKNIEEVQKYIQDSQSKSDLERTELNKEKTGVELQGVKAINPFTKQEIPIYVGDFVLGHYGTGAVMAVPAHDERDFEFAKKHKIGITPTIVPVLGEVNQSQQISEMLEVVQEVNQLLQAKNIKVWFNGTFGVAGYYGKFFDLPADVDCGVLVKDFLAAKEVVENNGYQKIEDKENEKFKVSIYQKGKIILEIGTFDHDLGDQVVEINNIKYPVPQAQWLADCYRITAVKERRQGKNDLKRAIFLEEMTNNIKEAYTEDGVLTNSEKFTGLTSAEAREKMADWLEQELIGKRQVNYKLRDWIFSRQRYWGEPIPLVYCETCAKRKPKILLIHGLGGNTQENWFPYFKREMENRGYEVLIPDLPKAEKLALNDWLKPLSKLGLTTDDELFVVGHSLGAPAAMQFILKNKLPVKKLILVAPVGHSSDWQHVKQYDFTDNEINTIKLFGGAKVDFAQLNNLVAKTTLYFSQDDPYIPVTMQQDFLELHGKVVVFKDKKHFSSRWGTTELPEILEEFPSVSALNLGWVPVPEEELPIKLPAVEKYEPSGTGESPLVNVPEWVNTKCPRCGGKAKRETNTMPQWAGSCWYYLAYAIVQSLKFKVQSKKYEWDLAKINYWNPVDVYVGGAEHAVLHLLYARFWHKVLFDAGFVSTPEPFMKLKNQGMILGENNEKMSKSRGNVVNPDEVLKEYGADTFRLYEMFMGPFEDAKPWNTKSIIGVRRFLEKIYNLSDRIGKESNPDLEKILHQTIKKVGEDIENFRFNTAISQMMILVNALQNQADDLDQEVWEKFLIILSPFAPHLAEELWEKLGHKKSISLEPWPKFDPKLILETEIEVVIQINGKVRDKITLPAESSEEEVKAKVLASDKIQKWLDNQPIKKFIYIKNRLVNIVI